MTSYRVLGPIGQKKQLLPQKYGMLARAVSGLIGVVGAQVALSFGWRPSGIKPATQGQDLSFLFTGGLNPQKASIADYARASAALGVEVAAIKAVAEVETGSKPFDNLGRPRILFERHIFHDLTHGKFSGKHPEISNKVSGGWGKFSSQYPKLEKAYKLDPDAALRSASWGCFQILGNNCKQAGFNSVNEFVLAMTRSEDEHLKAFTRFIANDKKRKMLPALRSKNWAAFAEGYNGSNYKKNDYDTKLKSAYDRFKEASVLAAHRPNK